MSLEWRPPLEASCRSPKPYVKVLTTPNGIMLNATQRDYSNTYWKRAPPAEANTDTSAFFIKIRSGLQFVIATS